MCDSRGDERRSAAWLSNRATSCPIPDIPAPGLTTYDAKDPDTSYPPIVPLRPPAGAPNVLLVLIDDVGFGASSAFGGPVPDAELRAARRGGPEVHPLPHDRAVLADPLGAAHRAQPPLGRHGQHRRARDLGARQQLDVAEHRRAARQDPEPQRLQHRAVRQVPRGAGVGDEPDGAVPPVADRAWASSTSTASSAARPTSGTRRSTRARRRSSRGTPEEGYYFNDDLTTHTIKWIRQQKALMPDKPFFAYYAPGATHAPHHVPKEWADKYKGTFDDGLGRAARGDLRAPEGARRDPAPTATSPSAAPASRPGTTSPTR